MGLTIKIKGYEGAYDCGYITYGNFIMRLIKEAYGDVCYEIFQRSLFSGRPFTELDEIEWAKHQNDDLELWIWHSDCDGKFTPQECRRIYNAIKDYVSKDDFTVGPYKEIYDRLFADLEEGHVEESKYISLFEDVDEQNDIGQLFTSSLADVETRDDLSKAVKDILISVKSNAYDDFCKNAGNDDDMIMETIKRKKDLESIKKVQINL